jgi:hypothetical protein
MTEPNKETVRTPLPTRPDNASPSAGAAKKHDTVRIVLPSRTPGAPQRRLPPTISLPRPPLAPTGSVADSPLLQPLPKPPGPEVSAESRAAIKPAQLASEPRPADSTQAGPKNETSRISILPRPTPAPAPVLITAKPADPFAAIPRSFCWTLFGIAALIFLIQIWNYVVS